MATTKKTINYIDAPKNGYALIGPGRSNVPPGPPQPIYDVYRMEGDPRSGFYCKMSEELSSGIKRLIYDYEGDWAVLELPVGHCTDMTGAINFVRRSFPDVKQIQTFSGGVPDSIYLQFENGWQARRPKLSEKQGLA